MEIMSYYLIKIPLVMPSWIIFLIALFTIFLVFPSVLSHKQYFKKKLSNKIVFIVIGSLVSLFILAVTDLDEIKAYRMAEKYGWKIEEFYPKQDAVFLDISAFDAEGISKHILDLDKTKTRFFDISSQEAISAMICSEIVGQNVYPYINKPIKLYSFQSVIYPSIVDVDVLIGIYNHEIIFAALGTHLPHYQYLPVNYTSEEIIQEIIKGDLFYIPIYGDRRLSYLPGGYLLFGYGKDCCVISSDTLNPTQIIPTQIINIGMDNRFILAQQRAIFTSALDYVDNSILPNNDSYGDNYYILDTAVPAIYKSTSLPEFEANCNVLNVPKNIKLHDTGSFFIRSKGRLVNNQFDNQVDPTYFP